jgi:SAM-dependent methyltransferase
MTGIFRWFNIVADNNETFNSQVAAHVKGLMLDVGCGHKQKVFRSSVSRYIGLEYPETRKINDRLSDTDADVYGNALHLPFKNGSFDSAVALHLFEHLEDPWLAASEMYRILKKGGTLGVTAPFMQKMHSEPCDFFRFTIHGIKLLLENAGFKVIKVSKGGGMWKVIGARLSGYLYSDVLGLGYAVDDLRVRPKKWLLPFFIPLIFAVVLFSRIMDRIHYVDKDSLGYCVICEKIG